MSALKFDIIGDNKNIIKALDGTKAGIRSTVKEAEQAGLDMDAIFRKIGSAAAAIGIGFSAKELVGKIVRVRGEIESLQKSFDVLAGAKGGELFEQIKEFAVKTPMDMPELAKGAQTLMAFNTEAEEVMPILKTMGDIAMGNKDKFQSLILAFSQMRSSGKLMGQDLMQMINAGFNPLSVISEQTGKSVGQLKEEMSKGAISAEMVTKAFMDATAEGGKFHGMLETMSGGVEGMKSNLEGAFTDMLNEIGEKSQGAITGTISVLTKLVENYEKVGRIVAELAGAFGVYKAALVTLTAIESVQVSITKGWTIAEIAHYNALLLVDKAQKLVKLSSPYALTAMAITAVVAGIYKLVSAKSAEEKAIDRVNKLREEENKKAEEQKQNIDKLLGVINDDTETRYNQIKAYEDLTKEVPELTNELSLEALQAMSAAEQTKKLKEILEGIKIDNAKDQLSEYTRLLGELMNYGGNFRTLSQETRDALRDLMGSKWKGDIEEAIVFLRARIADIKTVVNDFNDSQTPINVKIQIAEGEVALIQKDFDNIKAKYDEAKAKFDKGEITFFDYKKIESEYRFVEKRLTDAKNLRDKLKQDKPESPNYGEEYDKAEKAWRDASKALEDATNNRSKYTKEQYKEFVRKEKEAADAFKELGGDTSKKVGDERVKNEERAGEMFLEIVRRNNRDRIELEHEGNELLLQQIEQDYQDRIAEIEKQEQELMELQGGTLNPEQQAEFNRSRGIALEQRNKSTKKVEENIAKEKKSELEELLADYLTYEQKREQIQKEYAEKRKKMQEAGVGQGNIDILNQEEADALSATDEAFAQKSSTYRTWLNEITTLTLTELEAALIEAQEMLATLDQGGASEEQKMEARAKISKLGSKIQQMKEDNTMSPEKRSIEDWKELADVLKDCGDEFGSLGDEVGGTAGEILKSVGSITSTALGMVNNIVQIVDMSTNGMKATAQGAATAISTVEKASVILAIISVALQLIQKIVNFANKMHDGKYDEVIDRNQKKIDNLEKSYEDLAEAVDEAFGSTAVQGLRDMNANLEQQNRLIQEQKQAEEEKKKTDEETMKGYDDAMEENRKQIEANKKAMEEAIFGDDIKSAIENFSEAYADAVSDNMSMNQSAAEQAKQAMKKMVMESIKEYVAGSNKIQAIRDKMQALYADGVFSTEDQKIITDLYKNLNKEIDQKFEWAEGILSDSESSSSEESSNRGIATASQESVDENNGRLMSIQLSMGEITAHMAGIVASLSSITSVSAENNIVLSDIRTLQVQSNGWLEDIAKYTKPLNESITSIVEQLKKMQ